MQVENETGTQAHIWAVCFDDLLISWHDQAQADLLIKLYAPDYGNEVECGQGVARAIKDGLVKREELFIVSKLWNTFHDKERVEPICKKQLADWGIDYFDLYIVHFPVALEYVDPSVRYPPGW